MEKKSPFCTLTDQELIEKTTELVQQLIDTGGKSWVLNIPARPNSDPDLIFTELNYRFKNCVEQDPQGPVWVKASMRLPKPEIGKEVIFINRTHNASLIWEFTSDLGPSLNIHLDGWSLDQWEWLDESATPAAPAGHDNALYETRLALRDMVKLAKHIGCKIAEYNQYSQRVEAAEAMLQKHSKVTDMLRAPAAGREENMSEAQFLFFNNWLSEGGYSYDGEYYYNEANDFFTPAQLYQLFKEQNK